MGRGRLILFGAIFAAVFALVGALILYLNRDQGYDPAFDASVAAPAYGDNGPVVLFDEGHNNLYLSSTGYRPFAQLLRNDGYDVEVSEGELTGEVLAPAAVLVIVAPRGANEANDDPAFSEREANAISEWVLRGGALLLITDHWPIGTAAAPLAERFGVESSAGVTTDVARAEIERAENHIIYEPGQTELNENHIAFDSDEISDHPVINGRNERERVSRVLTFSGQSLLGPADASPFLLLSPRAQDWLPTPTPSGSMSFSESQAAGGRTQGVAVRFGRGRVVVLADADMLRAHTSDETGAIGMNREGYDNKQLALNIMHWLSRLI